MYCLCFSEREREQQLMGKSMYVCRVFHHTVTTMTLDNTVAFDTIVALVIYPRLPF
jgi:hypothetical protein